MKAIGYSKKGTIAAETSVVEFDADMPVIGARDLLVEVRGVSVNPVDLKVRARSEPEGGPRILGFDAAGVVKETGTDAGLFKPGDEVFYAGALTRPGSNAEFQAVDERIVGRKPSSLDFAEAAGLPLTSITAWEILFDSFGIAEKSGKGEALLIIGAAGGVGSILIQLAKKLTGFTVIATASRKESADWVKKMGADHVVDHARPLDEEIKALGIAPEYVAALNDTGRHFPAIVELIKPRGHIAVIDDPQGIDISTMKLKSLSLRWEFMFTRSMFLTDDMDAQHKLLCRVADMIDDGTLVSTVGKHCGALNGKNLREALTHQEAGGAIGKTVLGGMAGD